MRGRAIILCDGIMCRTIRLCIVLGDGACLNEDPGGGMISLVGWDIGGVNVKASCLVMEKGKFRPSRVVSRPFEIWRDKDHLPEVLRKVFNDCTLEFPVQAMSVTMSAELSDIFATKREGVRFVLECVRGCFPNIECYVLNLSGDLVLLKEACTSPLDFAATNWLASARWLSDRYPDCLLVDVGSTTTDILPILGGKVCVDGRTDTERLSSGELVYTGFLRTNLAAIVQSVPVAGRSCRVSSEYFAVSGDVHLILGHLEPRDYTCPAPDNRPPTVESARSRLARLVCADTEMLSLPAIEEMARYVYRQQVLQIRAGLQQVLSRLPELCPHPVVVFGAGAFLGEEAALGLGLKIQNLEIDFSREKTAAVPCLAVAHLLAAQMERES
jgi:probable H4MPT-linked C1 transfer pathway protein